MLPPLIFLVILVTLSVSAIVFSLFASQNQHADSTAPLGVATYIAASSAVMLILAPKRV